MSEEYSTYCPPPEFIDFDAASQEARFEAPLILRPPFTINLGSDEDECVYFVGTTSPSSCD